MHRFKWAHLNERLAYEKAVHAQRMRAEISQAKREANFYIQNAETSERLKKKEKRKRKQPLDTETSTAQDNSDSEKVYSVRLKDTEEEIVNKKRKLSDHESNKKKMSKKDVDKRTTELNNVKKKAFLSKIFAGGIDSDGASD